MTGEPLKPNGLPLQGETSAPSPTFTCMVYVKQVEGKVQARVANLEMPPIAAATQRDALRRISAAFKARLNELRESGEAIQWIDPPSAIEPGERKLSLPLHL